MKKKQRIAIIGASTGQLPLAIKARELGIETFCFAWDKDAIAKSYCDHFFPISITDYDEIEKICKENNIEGVVSNGSDVTAKSVSIIAEKLRLNAIKSNDFNNIINKTKVREITNGINGLEPVRVQIIDNIDNAKINYPCVVKPVNGGAKKGVSYVENLLELNKALEYCRLQVPESKIIIEDYVEGNEISVETLSYRGKHYIVQITDKESSGPPHFVELAHHQPAALTEQLKIRLKKVVNDILTNVGFNTGAAHIEFKINGNKIYLIEINPRGGGDEISNKLIFLSTGFDYLKAIIDISLDRFKPDSIVNNNMFSGIYYLCSQNRKLMPVFEDESNFDWLSEKKILNKQLTESTTNYDRDGYLIYSSDHKITF